MKRTVFNVILLLCFTIIITGSFEAGAQNSPFAYFGEIEGNVVDCWDNPIPDIQVYLRGISFIARTGEMGNFSFVNVPAGFYELVVEHPSVFNPIDIEVFKKQTTTLSDIRFIFPDQKIIYFKDADGDNFADPNDYIETCIGAPPPEDPSYRDDVPPADCDDSDPNTHPGAPEVCDGKDNNCNGEIDVILYLLDHDQDGWGVPDPNTFFRSFVCDPSQAPPDYYPGIPPGDCNDDDPNIFPGQGC